MARNNLIAFARLDNHVVDRDVVQLFIGDVRNQLLRLQWRLHSDIEFARRRWLFTPTPTPTPTPTTPTPTPTPMQCSQFGVDKVRGSTSSVARELTEIETKGLRCGSTFVDVIIRTKLFGEKKRKKKRERGKDRMRVLGCGVLSPPKKRQFSSIKSICNTNAKNGRLVGAGNDNDSSARTFLESAGSFARDSGRVAEDERSPGLRIPHSNRIITIATIIELSFRTCPLICEERNFSRYTCLTFGNSRKRLHDCTPEKASNTRSLLFGR
ncbi:hypothetical protein PUN28_009647 [Cardiocondyla obscurior]|uniref:Uncharacterized protein n=1 Tax=Cardiocondyla obscurior TaxID=286306 RepID=A0AAW2FTB4_9HYME